MIRYLREDRVGTAIIVANRDRLSQRLDGPGSLPGRRAFHHDDEGFVAFDILVVDDFDAEFRGRSVAARHRFRSP